MTQNFRWGLIGPGNIATRFAESLNFVEGTSLYAVASRDIKRATKFGEKFGARQCYQNYQALCEDPHVDAIYIATPHRFHFEQAHTCLTAKKPVLCEKPFTVNAREHQILVDLATQNQVFMMEAMWTLFLPTYRQIHHWLKEETIGDTKLLQSSFGFVAQRNPVGRLFNHELAGGTLLDMGVYNVAISQWLLKKPLKDVLAHAYIGATGVDETISVSMNFGDGVFSQFFSSFHSQLPNNFIVNGSKGSICIGKDFWGAEKVQLKIGNNIETLSFPFRGRGFEYEIEHAIACIQEEKTESNIMSHEATQSNMKIMDSIRQQIGLRYCFE